MYIKKRLMGCMEIDNLIYSENISLPALFSLSEEANRISAKYADKLANFDICIFHIDALIKYCALSPSKKAEVSELDVGENTKVISHLDCYYVTRVSEHFYTAKIMERLMVPEEDRIRVRTPERLAVETRVREEVRETAVKTERIRLHI